MSLPKYPIAGSQYNARQIAKMPVNQISDFLDFSGIKVKRIKADMENQEPGILETLEEEVREFLDQREQQEEQANKAKPVPAKFKKQQDVETKQRYKKQSKRIGDMATWLNKRGQVQDRPGAPGKVGYVQRGGRPGNINPIQRQ